MYHHVQCSDIDNTSTTISTSPTSDSEVQMYCSVDSSTIAIYTPSPKIVLEDLSPALTEQQSTCTIEPPTPLLAPLPAAEVDQQYAFSPYCPDSDDLAASENPLSPHTINTSRAKCCPLNCYGTFDVMEAFDIRNNFKRRSKALQMQYLLDILHATSDESRINKIILKSSKARLNESNHMNSFGETSCFTL